MKKFGFDWPEHMNCDLFPEYGSTNQVCMDPMDAQFQTAHKNKKLNINFFLNKFSGRRKIRSILSNNVFFKKKKRYN